MSLINFGRRFALYGMVPMGLASVLLALAPIFWGGIAFPLFLWLVASQIVAILIGFRASDARMKRLGWISAITMPPLTSLWEAVRHEGFSRIEKSAVVAGWSLGLLGNAVGQLKHCFWPSSTFTNGERLPLLPLFILVFLSFHLVIAVWAKTEINELKGIGNQ